MLTENYLMIEKSGYLTKEDAQWTIDKWYRSVSNILTIFHDGLWFIVKKLEE